MGDINLAVVYLELLHGLICVIWSYCM